ncbi:MAG: hypothetical protein Q9225_000317 [Loekoesia sp. 1 TL-2023]
MAYYILVLSLSDMKRRLSGSPKILISTEDVYSSIMKQYMAAAITLLFMLQHTTAAQPAPQAPDVPPPARSPDKCGPIGQGAGDPPDSCTAKPPTVSSAAAFGIVGSKPGDRPISPYDWSSCDPTVIKICKTMARANTTAGTWYFETGPAGYPHSFDEPCQMGFWLPNDAPLKSPKSNPAAAPKPDEHQCQVIFNATVSAAAAQNPYWIGASVNLVTNPADQKGQWALPGGSGTGIAYPLDAR